jgi:hypothetical protein
MAFIRSRVAGPSSITSTCLPGWVEPIAEEGMTARESRRSTAEAVRELIEDYQATLPALERREQDRVDLFQPVKVRTVDGREYTLLSRDLSPSGMRLLGTRGLLGEKVRVGIPRPGGGEPLTVRLYVLWTTRVADDLFESGGTFFEPAPGEAD